MSTKPQYTGGGLIITHSEIMGLAVAEARKTMRKDIGGPFGAAIVDKDGNVICIASNTVLQDNDPTAHAEMNAIRKACSQLNTYDLSGCTLYATGYPCPMCLSAIIWANIKTVYYGCTPKDADSIGFRDDFIYDFIQSNNSDTNILKLDEVSRDMCISLFNEYSDSNKSLY